MKKGTKDSIALFGVTGTMLLGLFGISVTRQQPIAERYPIKVDGLSSGTVTIPADGDAYNLEVQSMDESPIKLVLGAGKMDIKMDPGTFQLNQKTVTVAEGAKLDEVTVAPDSYYTIVEGHKDGHSIINGAGLNDAYQLSGPGNEVSPGQYFNLYNVNPGTVTTVKGFTIPDDDVLHDAEKKFWPNDYGYSTHLEWAGRGADGVYGEYFSVNTPYAASPQAYDKKTQLWDITLPGSEISHYRATLCHVAGTDDNVLAFESSRADEKPAYFDLPSSGALDISKIYAGVNGKDSARDACVYTYMGKDEVLPMGDSIPVNQGLEITKETRDKMLSVNDIAPTHAEQLRASRRGGGQSL